MCVGGGVVGGCRYAINCGCTEVMVVYSHRVTEVCLGYQDTAEIRDHQ